MSRKFKPTKVTAEVFAEVKNAIDSYCLSREMVMFQFDIGHETYRLIKKSKTYKDYQNMTRRKTQLAKQRSAQKLKKAQEMRKRNVNTRIIRVIELQTPRPRFNFRPVVKALAFVLLILLALLVGARLGGLQ